MILPDQTSGPKKLLTFAGKEGSIYLLDRTAMGGYTPTNVCTTDCLQSMHRQRGSGAVESPRRQADTIADGANRDAYWGAPAYFRIPPDTSISTIPAITRPSPNTTWPMVR